MAVKTEQIINSDLWRIFPFINIDHVKEIPCDYPGAMGVPITFLDKYNPEQFELLGITTGHERLEDGRIPYRRLIIRNKKPDLPDEIDLKELLERCGMEVVLENLEAEKSAMPEGPDTAQK